MGKESVSFSVVLCIFRERFGLPESDRNGERVSNGGPWRSVRSEEFGGVRCKLKCNQTCLAITSKAIQFGVDFPATLKKIQRGFRITEVCLEPPK